MSVKNDVPGIAGNVNYVIPINPDGSIASIERSISNAVTMTPSNAAASNVAAGRMISVKCTAAGDVSVLLSGGSTFVFAVQPGQAIYPFEVVRVNTTGTTATATYANLS